MKKAIRTFSNDETLVDERRKNIIKCSATLFLKKGYDRTSMRELAKVLGVSTGGLYHYIGSKSDILQLHINLARVIREQNLQTIRKKIKNLSPTEALRESIKMYLQLADEYQDNYNFLNHVVVNLSPSDRHMLYDDDNQILAYFERLLINGVEAGEFKIDNPRLAAFNIVIIANAWANRRWFLRKHFTLRDYIREQTELILKEIGANTSQTTSDKEDKDSSAGVTYDSRQ